ncbi:hypothetical protein [Terasakiella pusilla]|uniref:hypothetical protein n=1 Tax=Terasakiella pusilla TaxID=64973 RepID=UPI00048D0822|nr:hypothetical protein [Terasakiella pusilla]
MKFKVSILNAVFMWSVLTALAVLTVSLIKTGTNQSFFDHLIEFGAYSAIVVVLFYLSVAPFAFWSIRKKGHIVLPVYVPSLLLVGLVVVISLILGFTVSRVFVLIVCFGFLEVLSLGFMHYSAHKAGCIQPVKVLKIVIPVWLVVMLAAWGFSTAILYFAAAEERVIAESVVKPDTQATVQNSAKNDVQMASNTVVAKANVGLVAWDAYVVDVNNGLLWMRCPVGMRYEKGTCTGQPRRLDFATFRKEANEITRELTYSPMSYWHLPTLAEQKSVSACLEAKPFRPAEPTADIGLFGVGKSASDLAKQHSLNCQKIPKLNAKEPFFPNAPQGRFMVHNSDRLGKNEGYGTVVTVGLKPGNLLSSDQVGAEKKGYIRLVRKATFQELKRVKQVAQQGGTSRSPQKVTSVIADRSTRRPYTM